MPYTFHGLEKLTRGNRFTTLFPGISSDSLYITRHNVGANQNPVIQTFGTSYVPDMGSVTRANAVLSDTSRYPALIKVEFGSFIMKLYYNNFFYIVPYLIKSSNMRKNLEDLIPYPWHFTLDVEVGYVALRNKLFPNVYWKLNRVIGYFINGDVNKVYGDYGELIPSSHTSEIPKPVVKRTVKREIHE